MAFVLIGTLLALLKYLAVDPVATLSWWWVLSPFALAIAWWSYADSTGLTAKRNLDRFDQRREKRRRQSLEAMGLDPNTRQRAGNAKAVQRESQREEKRRKNADTVTRSSTQFGSEFPASTGSELAAEPPADKRG